MRRLLPLAVALALAGCAAKPAPSPSPSLFLSFKTEASGSYVLYLSDKDELYVRGKKVGVFPGLTRDLSRGFSMEGPALGPTMPPLGKADLGSFEAPQ